MTRRRGERRRFDAFSALWLWGGLLVAAYFVLGGIALAEAVW